MEHSVTIANMFYKAFPDIPVLSIIGNHDTFPVNQMGGHDIDDWIYNHTDKKGFWSNWFNEDALKTYHYSGFYA